MRKWFAVIFRYKSSHESIKLVTSVYRKPTSSAVFTNFESFITDIYERGLNETLLHRIFRLCSNYENFHQEIETFKSKLKHNSFSHNLVGKASLDVRTRLRRTIEGNLLYYKLKVIFRSNCRLNTLFRFKNWLGKKIRSGIIYRYTCSNWKVTYYVKTFRHFFTMYLPGKLLPGGFSLKSTESLLYFHEKCMLKRGEYLKRLK